jgi:hypothetical protein
MRYIAPLLEQHDTESREKKKAAASRSTTGSATS